MVLEMSPPSSKSEGLDSEEWEWIANTLANMDCGVDAKCAKTRRLRAELGLIRQILSSEIKGWNGNGSIDLSFFMGSFKAIKKMEGRFASLGIKKTEFLIFLELVLKRFEKQKLLVKKPLATISEFKKMKGVVENEEEHL